MIKICCITGIFPPDIGGPATYVSRLAHELHQRGHLVQVITLGDHAAKTPGETVTKYPFPVRRIPRSIPWPIRLLLLFFIFLWYAGKADVWYINGLELPAVLAGKLLRKRLLMKVVGDYAWERAMNHDATSDSIDDFQHKPQSWKIELHKRVRAWLARQVETVITPSQYLQQLVCGWGVPVSHIRIIYNAVELPEPPEQSKAELKKSLGLSEKESLIVTVGRLVTWKHIDLIVRALHGLDGRATLLVIGKGPEKNRLTELADALNVSSRVKFLGRLEHERVSQYLYISDIFVLFSTYEGLPHVVLEAMNLGTPVITSAAGGTPEVVKQHVTGRLVTPLQVDELRHALAELLASPDERQKLAQNAAVPDERFQFATMLNETLRVLLAA